jgi:hypothetical protein
LLQRDIRGIIRSSETILLLLLLHVAALFALTGVGRSLIWFPRDNSSETFFRRTSEKERERERKRKRERERERERERDDT